MRLSLRAKILVSILSAVVVTDLLAAWAINRRIEAGADREADAQARAQATQARALYTPCRSILPLSPPLRVATRSRC
jgi:hypothetical protein